MRKANDLKWIGIDWYGSAWMDCREETPLPGWFDSLLPVGVSVLTVSIALQTESGPIFNQR
ncbi:MAG: hypothetical protein ACYCTV_10240 [Leptospirales bacterium]